MTEIVIQGRPVINAAYRRRLHQLGLDPTARHLNPRRLPGSVRVTCDLCDNGAWISPKQQEALAKVAATQPQDLVKVVCLLCGFQMAAETIKASGRAVIANLRSG